MFTTKKNKPGTRLFRFVCVFLPLIMGIQTLFLWSFREEAAECRDILGPVIFILSFCFIFIFYLYSDFDRIFKDNDSISIEKAVTILATVSLSFLCVHFSASAYLVPLIVITTSVMSGIIRLECGLILIAGVVSYLSVFMSSSINGLSIYLPLAAVMCIVVSFIRDTRTLIYSLETVTIVYIIVLIYSSDFILSDIFKLERLVIYLVFMSVMTGIYFFNKRRLMSGTDLPDMKGQDKTFNEPPERELHLTEEMNSIKQDNELLIKEKDAFKSDNELLIREKNSLESKNRQLSEEKESLRSSNELLNRELISMKNKSELLNSENNSLRDNRELLIRENNLLKNERELFIADKDSLNKDVELLLTDYEVLENEKKELEKVKAFLMSVNEELNAKFDELNRRTAYTVQDVIEDASDFIVLLKEKAPKLYRHCHDIAMLSSEAAGLINCDRDEAYAIAIYHEADRLIGGGLYEELLYTYKLPAHIAKAVVQVKDKNNTIPMTRETGIVILSDDIYTTIMYLRSKKTENIPQEKIIVNAFKLRKEQGLLSLAGLTQEEAQLLKIYYNDCALRDY